MRSFTHRPTQIQRRALRPSNAERVLRKAMARGLGELVGGAISALDGMQPTFRQAPPGFAASTITVSRPKSAVALYRRSRWGWAPMTRKRQETTIHQLQKIMAAVSDQHLDALDEDGGVPAVDDAQLKADEKIDDLARDELVPVWADGDLVDADDRHLGAVDDRVVMMSPIAPSSEVMVITSRELSSASPASAGGCVRVSSAAQSQRSRRPA